MLAIMLVVILGVILAVILAFLVLWGLAVDVVGAWLAIIVTRAWGLAVDLVHVWVVLVVWGPWGLAVAVVRVWVAVAWLRGRRPLFIGLTWRTVAGCTVTIVQLVGGVCVPWGVGAGLLVVIVHAGKVMLVGEAGGGGGSVSVAHIFVKLVISLGAFDVLFQGCTVGALVALACMLATLMLAASIAVAASIILNFVIIVIII
jgi:hypothetical protein